MKIIIETERLFLSEMAEEEAPDFFELNSDWEVMKYTGDKTFADVEDARQLLINYPYYKRYGFGRHTVRLKDTGEFLGWCGLKYREDINEVDIGYRLLRKHWNKGYATEASLTSLQYGFETHKIQRIIGQANVQNGASIRVFQKIGLQFEKYLFVDGVDDVQYCIEKPI